MAVLLAWIICPIVFGICFITQTVYFIYKILQSRNTDYSGSTPVTTIHMTDGEATCCMGWAWTSCIDKTTNRITLNTFIAWYVVATCVDIIITVIFYLILYHWRRIYV
ncbi:unnamed protein product [Rotaria sp. Silwood1]|nr:unnamed protein product [Rotaria sp. Silwood1]CAF1602306.1 unnamed protein product [Rotaria sp. Silwood1]CAF1605043.1 unnamed protein product [Rotaria sp. Silwood1]CAF3686888.1 unnamed protein product [Rotaria sp. Silwood1]CAF3745861.1 unnamed protein product [Rotaria sp. Silwood1]